MIEIDFTTKPSKNKSKDIIPEYVVDKWGYKRLYDENGQLHSYNDLPAWIWPEGTKIWYIHGLTHRGNGLPAIIYSDGVKEWHENNVFIRDESPNDKNRFYNQI